MIFNKLILTDKMVYLSANTNYFIHAGTACGKTSGSQKISLTLCAVSGVCFFTILKQVSNLQLFSCQQYIIRLYKSLANPSGKIPITSAYH